MSVPTPAASFVVNGAAAALFVEDSITLTATELPMTKATLKISGEKTEITGSASVYNLNGFKKIWKEHGEGASGFSMNWQSFWRASQSIRPMDMQQSANYDFLLYVRRPGWNNGDDAGSAYTMDCFTDDMEMDFEPKSGVFSWNVSTTGQGGLTFPT